MSISINLQPDLDNEWVRLTPLSEQHFDALYSVASDPELWVQHQHKKATLKLGAVLKTSLLPGEVRPKTESNLVFSLRKDRWQL